MMLKQFQIESLFISCLKATAMDKGRGQDYMNSVPYGQV
jgi:hypothetical protein